MTENDEEHEIYVTETRYNKGTKLPVVQHTRLNGLLHAPPDGSPSEIDFDEAGRPYRLTWHHENYHHREDGAALVEINPDNGIHTAEYYYIFGQHRDRADGPHLILRDEITGQVTQEVFKGDPDFPSNRTPPHFAP